MNVIEKTRAAVSTVGNWATAKTTAQPPSPHPQACRSPCKPAKPDIIPTPNPQTVPQACHPIGQGQLMWDDVFANSKKTLKIIAL